MARGNTRRSAKGGAGHIASSTRIQPYQQGEFDGFCGIYATINGLQLLLEPHRALRYGDVAQLYQRGIKVLQEGERLPFAVTWGISQGRWRHIVFVLCARASRITGLAALSTQPFPAYRRYSREAVFGHIEAAIDAQQPVLVALRGAYNHYSVICAYTPSRYVLHDSYAYRWIYKASCGVSLEPGRWRHRIATRSVLVLGIGT